MDSARVAHWVVISVTGSSTSIRRRRWFTLLDLLLIASLSTLAQATHFSQKQGRALPCGDSAQYRASAEALLGGQGSPHFEMRKPGYVFYLAFVASLFGSMGWAATVGNHIFLGLLPLAAYGFGRHLRGRFLGWCAAGMTIAQLQFVFWGDRVLSESLFTCLFSFGLLWFVWALRREGHGVPMIGAGLLMGMALLTRGSATPVIVAASLMILIVLRNDWRRALLSCVCFCVPIVACISVECGLNWHYAGQFRPSNGTVGATILLRARHFEGASFPEGEETEQIARLLPERSREDLYLADHLDIWVARHRAIHDQGMSEWEYDDLMGRVGRRAIASVFPAYLLSSMRLTLAHLLRDPNGQRLAAVDKHRYTGPIIHPAAGSQPDWDNNWYAFYGTPHLDEAGSKELADRMHQAAAAKAPFGDSPILRAMRYWKTHPAVVFVLKLMRKLGCLWPGFAILACGWLGLDRRTCGFLALAYFLEALFLGLLTPTNMRLQFIWIVTDTVLAAGLLVGIADRVLGYARESVLRRRPCHASPIGVAA